MGSSVSKKRGVKKTVKNIDTQEEKMKKEEVAHVISVLHTNIRSMELLLNVAYRLTLKKWQVSVNSCFIYFLVFLHFKLYESFVSDFQERHRGI